jgi:manganese/zinc/iron transport system permease protein
MGTTGTLLSAIDRRLPAGPAIILVGAGFFVLSMLFAPRQGTLARLLVQWRLRRQLREVQLSLPNADGAELIDDGRASAGGPGRG